MISQLQWRIARYRFAIENHGLWPTLYYKLLKVRDRRVKSISPIQLRSRYALSPLTCRPNTSDIDVFGQIFVFREYRCLDDLVDPGLIIDCGANVGFSSIYFLSRFPNTFVIAIEPDSGNFEALQRNLEQYSARCRLVHSAIWSHPAWLVMSDEANYDGREWDRSVREARDDETPEMRAVDVGTLLSDSGYSRISILKVDIEGAEAAVFGSNYESWISHVDALVIELHGEACAAAFFGAISDQRFTLSQCDELTVCKRQTGECPDGT